MRTRRPFQADTPPHLADPGSEWRWQNYAERLTELGYDLHGGTAGGEKPAAPRPHTPPDPRPPRT